MQQELLTPDKSETSADLTGQARPYPGWIKVSAIAAASALSGGLAAAWYYRKTLTKLQLASETAETPDFGITEEHVDPDT